MARSKSSTLRRSGDGDEKLVQKLKKMESRFKGQSLKRAEKVVSLSDERIIERDAAKKWSRRRIKPTLIRRRTRSRTQRSAVFLLPPEIAAAPVGAA